MHKRRFTPSPAMVVSLIALFVALGGTSYAAITNLPPNSVGTPQLQNSAVTGPKLHNHSVTAAKIHALGPAKVVGASGAPAYHGSWGAPIPNDEGVSFYKDPWGIVHLQGDADNSSGAATGTIFKLPVGYRPAGVIEFAAFAGPGGSGDLAYIMVTSNGEVDEVIPQQFVGLSGITFRAGL